MFFLFFHQTRILVTHGLHWLPKVDQIVVLEHGHISEIGTYDELLIRNGAFAQFLKTFLMNNAEDEDEEEDEECEYHVIPSSII